jgi:hypothetical protein
VKLILIEDHLAEQQDTIQEIEYPFLIKMNKPHKILEIDFNLLILIQTHY